MSDEYLWDRSGTPDPDVERLEALLAPLRSTPDVREVQLKLDATTVHATDATDQTWGPALAGPTEVWSVRYLAPLVAAAAVIALMIAATWQSTRSAASWEVARVNGQPRIGSTALAGTGRIAVGQTLVTD